MTTPNPGTPVLMTALAVLCQSTWAGRLADVQPGQAFWARYADQAGLIEAGLARGWQAGDPPAPAPEPAYTAHGTAGFGAGTTNSSH